MANDFQPGDPVEVHQILAGCAPGYGEPLAAWCKGYFYVRPAEPGCIFVAARTGIFANQPVRYRTSDVRPMKLEPPCCSPNAWGQCASDCPRVAALKNKVQSER